jgi:hypothetical protein
VARTIQGGVAQAGTRAGDALDMATTGLQYSRALVRFDWLGDRVLCLKLTGELGEDSGPVLAATFDGLLTETIDAITLCWDLARVRHWEPVSRRAVVRTLLAHRDRISEHLVHVPSPQLRMDMHIVGLALGNMSCWQARSLFDLAIDAVIGGAQHRDCA